MHDCSTVVGALQSAQEYYEIQGIRVAPGLFNEVVKMATTPASLAYALQKNSFCPSQGNGSSWIAAVLIARLLLCYNMCPLGLKST